ncbi:hypothetical protein DM860_012126 [Cuscuta australis]|uniref:RING-type domain-containing protein n=1 Tax=Cuscuta australis TaxID=267555 RepID=A0A328DEJ3_9ASTE|nr:hypothetical protein DM860_012126 [Cuscuta australis]
MEVEEVEPFHWYITDRSVKLFFITFFIFLLSFLLFVFLFIRYIRNQIALFPDEDDDDVTIPSADPTAVRRQQQTSIRSNGTVSFTAGAALPSRERSWSGVVVGLEEVTAGTRPPVFGQGRPPDAAGGTAAARRFGGEECCICLGVFEEKEVVRVMPECMHVFHSQCIVRWLTARSNCPLCRSTI